MSLPELLGADGVGVIATIGQKRRSGMKTGEQVFGVATLSMLSFRKAKINRHPVGINESVDLRCQAASGTSHASIDAPLLPVAPC